MTDFKDYGIDWVYIHKGTFVSRLLHCTTRPRKILHGSVFVAGRWDGYTQIIQQSPTCPGTSQLPYRGLQTLRDTKPLRCAIRHISIFAMGFPRGCELRTTANLLQVQKTPCTISGTSVLVTTQSAGTPHTAVSRFLHGFSHLIFAHGNNLEHPAGSCKRKNNTTANTQQHPGTYVVLAGNTRTLRRKQRAELVYASKHNYISYLQVYYIDTPLPMLLLNLRVNGAVSYCPPFAQQLEQLCPAANPSNRQQTRAGRRKRRLPPQPRKRPIDHREPAAYQALQQAPRGASKQKIHVRRHSSEAAPR